MIPKEAKTEHNKIFVRLNKEFAEGMPEYDELKRMSRDYIKPAEMIRCKNVMELLQMLENKGAIAVGRYEFIRSFLRNTEYNNEEIYTFIDEQELKILDILDQSATSYTTTGHHAQDTQSDLAPIESHQEKRRKGEQTHAKQVQGCPRGGRPRPSAYDMSAGRGLLVLLNYKQNREGTDKDVGDIKSFFSQQNFEVRVHHDLDRKKIFQLVRELKHDLSKEFNPYTSLIVVMLGHGKEGEMQVSIERQEYIKYDELLKELNNENVPNFTGKPRVLIIQACFGVNTQPGFPETDAADTEQSISPTITVPRDADLMVVYATTEGNKSYRQTESGSWFIQDLLSVFRERFEEDHLEEMLIYVKERVAQRATPNGGKQMPYHWSTLTKRLYFPRR